MDCLTVPGKPEYLQAVLAFVQKAAESAGLDKRAAYRLRLAVDEIATNIVTHGYQEANLCGNLTVRFETEPQRVAVHLEDTGVPFDPSQALCAQQLRLPLLTRPSEGRPSEGGLGIYIALSNVDDFCYTRNGARNCSTLIMHRS